MPACLSESFVIRTQIERLTRPLDDNGIDSIVLISKGRESEKIARAERAHFQRCEGAAVRAIVRTIQRKKERLTIEKSIMEVKEFLAGHADPAGPEGKIAHDA